jgi:hypothetical protein
MPILTDNVKIQIKNPDIIPDIVQHNVPVVIKTNKYIWMICSASFLLILNIISAIIFYTNLLDNRINIKRMISFNNFSILNAKFETNENGKKQLIFDIKNQSKYNKITPIVRLNYLDSDKNVIKSSDIEDHDIIQSEEIITRNMDIDNIEFRFITMTIN